MTEKVQEQFLAYRRQQEAAVISRIDDSTDPMMSMLSIELNTTELCNRTCVFCPRVDPAIYPNRNLNMSLDTARKIAADLADFNFKGRISLSGFGEPLLNKKVPEIIRILRMKLPDNLIDTNTNGDRLTVEQIRALFDAGISAMYVNMYDGPEQREKFAAMFDEVGVPQDRYQLRPHWKEAEESYGLILNNRSGMVQSETADIKTRSEPMKHPCYYPFSRAMIDWNGDMLLCTNDWGRKHVVGSVIKESIRALWMSDDMYQVRRKLMHGDRAHQPCDKCDVDGTLSGQYAFDLLTDHYKRDGKI